MTRSERAAQIWPLLTFCATHRHVLTYELLSRLIGVLRPGLGQLLEPIQSYCILHDLPPLTSLVVSEITGLPGEGFMAAADLPEAQVRVFGYSWLDRGVPTPEELEQAVEALPSRGRALSDLLQLREQLRIGRD